MKKFPQKQRGFSLLEVMITMLIVSFGLLGIGGIIVISLKNNQGSYARGQATLMVNDMVDRMRANRGVAEAAPSPYNLALTATPAGTTVAATDLAEWRAALAASIPSGTGAVLVNDASKKVTITVQWDDSRGTTDTGNNVGLSNQQLVVETRL
ncbi:type IV pilus modification protein PilV [Massilia eurypsychrophila]|jgi:type IV pilus assembly protein PilV|uniref:Type IV pilus modification protein PilV n=1 Tax=Massilia eurypsychrophila TaxID=1485217 RepID=A0A2G8TJP9_9BURK|nr:type IV pilus modification protein PilV [Massilia eurypsychrophila]PIL45838.1 type IV pilus modification protein PilV [Massilia eurypsychrophila]